MSALFRKKSLDKLSSPEQLDKMIIVNSPATWFALLGGFLITVIVVIWGIAGRIPITVDGMGILLGDGGVTSAYAGTQGVITKVFVKGGDKVETGDPLYEVKNDNGQEYADEIKKRMKKVQAITYSSVNDEVTTETQQLISIKNQKGALSLNSDATKASLAALRSKYADAQSDLAKYEKKYKSAASAYYDRISSDDSNTVSYGYQTAESEYQAATAAYQTAKVTYETAVTATESYKKQYELTQSEIDKAAFEQAQNAEAKAKKAYDEAKAAYKQKKSAYEQKEKAYKSSVKNSASSKAQQTKNANNYNVALNEYQTAKSKVMSLEEQISSMEVSLKSGKGSLGVQQNALQKEFDIAKASVLDEMQKKLDEYEKLVNGLEICAETSGVVYSTLVTVGSAVTEYTEIARINPQTEETKLNAVYYFTLDSGKNIKEGMKINIYPKNYPKEEYGHMSGTVTSVAEFVTSQADLYLKSAMLLKLQNKLALISAHSFISHMFRLPMSFFDQRNVGDLSGRVENNNNVSVFLAGELGETCLNILVSAFYLILLLMYSPLLTLIGVVGAILNISLMKLSSAKIEDMSKKMQQDNGKLFGVFYIGVAITDTLKASGVENDYVARILGYYSKAATKGQEMAKTQEILNAIPEVSQNITNLLVLMFGGILVVNGSLTAGQLVAYTSLLGSFLLPINSLVGFIQKIQTMKTDMGRVEDIQNYKIDSAYDDNAEKYALETKLKGNVECKDISFGYSILEKPLVEHFNFNLTTGKSIAFVGSSGSGKSTVSKIISGLYQPWDGEVLLDGIPMRQIPPEILNVSVSTVSQQVTLFAGTIRDNLTMWDKHILESDMIKAAKDACIHDIITKKPGAYDFELTEGGQNLSGGQRQRLEIARALATNPTILIMDEATSALDPLVEKQIVDNIKRRGSTCIIVAHRLSAVRDCDEILVMSCGQIVQRGSHEELANVPGHYQNLTQQ